MAIVLNGSTGIQNVLGSASAPADTNTTTPTTGVYYPSATTWGVSTAGTNALYIDASQNVGIGTTSPVGKLDVVSTAQDQLSVRSNSTTAGSSILVSSGNGTTSNNYSYIQYQNAQTSAYNWKVGTFGSNSFSFYDATAAAERMRIDTSGNVGIGTTSALNGTKFSVNQTANSTFTTQIQSSASTPYGGLIYYASAAPNNSSSQFIQMQDNSAVRAYFNSNGGLANYQGNNSNLSDERLKKDIQLAGSYLDKICAIPVKTFLYNDQTDNELNLGVIAQDVLAVAPELVDQDGWVKTEKDQTQYLSIYQTDLQYALMKAIQELKAEFDAYKAAHP